MMPTEIDIAGIRQSLAEEFGFSLADIDNEIAKIGADAKGADVPDALAIYKRLLPGLPQRLTKNLEQRAYAEYLELPGLRERSTERLLEEAIQILRDCKALRGEYAELARLHVDATLKTLEFLLLDGVLQMEVAAGLYKNPYDDAMAELDAVNSSIEIINDQLEQYMAILKKGPDYPYPEKKENVGEDVRTFILNVQARKNLLSSNMVDVAAYWDGLVANRGLPNGVDRAAVYNYSNFASIRRGMIERLSWQMTMKSIQTMREEAIGRKNRSEIRAKYAKQDIAFRSARAQVTRQLAYTQLVENIGLGSILNYRNRMEELLVLYDVSLAKLVGRIRVLIKSLKLYGIDEDTLQPEKGEIVDAIALWLLSMHERVALRRYATQQFVATVMIPSEMFKASENGFVAEIDVTTEATRGLSGLLKGIALEYVSDGANAPVQMTVTPPTSVTGGIEEAGISVPLQFGRVGPYTPGIDVKAQHLDRVWNGVPYDTWKLAIGTEPSALGATSILMHLWMEV